MPTLSFLLRILSICAAAITVIFYLLGGNQLKETQSKLDEQVSISQQQQQDIKARDERLQKTKEELDATVMELAGLKRDKRLNDGEVLIVKQALDKLRTQLDTTESAKLALIDENEKLRRETIDLKAQGFDPNNNPKRLTAQIEDQRREIRLLESQLSDAQTVLTSLFSNNVTHSNTPGLAKVFEPSGHTQQTRIQRAVPEHQLLVLEIGAVEGIRQGMEFQLFNTGTPIARVKAARVKPNLCVVNILKSDEHGKKVLQTGTHIEYML